MRTLLILRHAKSDQACGLADHERPLNERGRKAATRIGVWMKENNLQPELVICSSATRTQETLELLRKSLTIPDTLVHIEERAYLASTETLLQLLAESPDDMDQILLVGHNPGVEALLTYLCGTDLPLTASGKLMTTANLAQVGLPDDWRGLTPGCGMLKQLVRPCDLPKE